MFVKFFAFVLQVEVKQTTNTVFHMINWLLLFFSVTLPSTMNKSINVFTKITGKSFLHKAFIIHKK